MSFSGLLGRTLLTVTAVVASALVPLASHAETERTSTATPTAVDGTDQGISVLDLRFTPANRSEEARSATLRCDPAGGNHPSAAAACEQLAAANGEFGELRAEEDRMCPLVYRPVNVRATGVWRNRPVNHSRTYSNECEMLANTGKIFDF